MVTLFTPARRSLQRYPLTTLKIDRGFIQHILDKPRDAAIAKALIGLGCDLGLETVAEGIETSAQEDALLALGCRTAQGYLYGRPMPTLPSLSLSKKLSSPIFDGWLRARSAVFLRNEGSEMDERDVT